MGNIHPETGQAIFRGQAEGDLLTLVCYETGYAILRNGIPERFWSAEQLESCVGAYLRLIDREPEPRQRHHLEHSRPAA